MCLYVCLSDSLIYEHYIQIMHVCLECHRSAAEFSLHLIRWRISIWAITSKAYFGHLIMVGSACLLITVNYSFLLCDWYFVQRDFEAI